MKNLTILKQQQKTYFPAVPVNNFKDLLNVNCASIFEIQLNEGTDFISAQLITALIDLLEFFSVGKTIEEEQIKQINSLIIARFPNLTLPDIMLCFNLAKTSYFSVKVYDHIDGSIIFSWLNEFIDIKKAEKARFERQKPLPELTKYTKEEEAEAQKYIDAIKQRLDAKRKALNKQIEIYEAAKPKSKEEIFIQKWIKHFQKISDRQNFNTAGGRFIRRNNKIFTLDEFINYRFNILETLKKR